MSAITRRAAGRRARGAMPGRKVRSGHAVPAECCKVRQSTEGLATPRDETMIRSRVGGQAQAGVAGRRVILSMLAARQMSLPKFFQEKGRVSGASRKVGYLQRRSRAFARHAAVFCALFSVVCQVDPPAMRVPMSWCLSEVKVHV